MKWFAVIISSIILNQFTILAQAPLKNQEQNLKSQEEKDWEEFREFKRRKENGELEGFKYDSNILKEKKWYISFQGSSGHSSTNLETGKTETGKVGIEYRISPSFGISFGIGSNNLDLKSIDRSSSILFAYFLLPTLNAVTSNSDNSSQLNKFLFASLLDSPTAFFYLSDSFHYRYTTGQIDFNFHLNQENFFDPYIGLGIIAGACASTYPCSIAGGEIKLGSQLNFTSYFTFFQIQAQLINIKEPGFAPFETRNSIGSLGVGVRF